MGWTGYRPRLNWTSSVGRAWCGPLPLRSRPLVLSVFVVEVVLAPAGVVRVGAEHVRGEQGGGFADGEPVVEVRDVG